VGFTLVSKVVVVFAKEQTEEKEEPTSFLKQKKDKSCGI
jgi:hypothetical protein